MIIASSKWAKVITWLFKNVLISGVVQQYVYETKIRDIEDL